MVQMAKVHDEVAVTCPDYASAIKNLLTAHEADDDVPVDVMPEAVADLITEIFTEPEPEMAVIPNDEEERREIGEETSVTEEDRFVAAKEKLASLKTTSVKVKQSLMKLESDAKSLELQQKQEVVNITEQWSGSKGDLRAHLKLVKDGHKIVLKSLKETQKEKRQSLKAEIKSLENKQIPQAERDLKLLSNRGKLELLLDDEELIDTLKERWISAEVAKQLDYPIFMAVSERGGKDNSGDYEYMLDDDGSLVEFPEGHTQEGQLVVNQDLVNYDLHAKDLANAATIPDDELCVAEAFVRFAQEQKLSFWKCS